MKKKIDCKSWAFRRLIINLEVHIHSLDCFFWCYFKPFTRVYNQDHYTIHRIDLANVIAALAIALIVAANLYRRLTF